LAQPHSAAVRPDTWLPATNDIYLARLGPSRKDHIGEMRPPPTGIDGQPIFASSATTVMSQNVHSRVAPARQ